MLHLFVTMNILFETTYGPQYKYQFLIKKIQLTKNIICIMNTSDKIDSGVYLQSKIIKAKFENNNKLYESNTPPTIFSLSLIALLVGCGVVVLWGVIWFYRVCLHHTKPENQNPTTPTGHAIHDFIGSLGFIGSSRPHGRRWWASTCQLKILSIYDFCAFFPFFERLDYSWKYQSPIRLIMETVRELSKSYPVIQSHLDISVSFFFGLFFLLSSSCDTHQIKR